MSQIVIYKGVRVEPVERSGEKILVRSKNPSDAQKAGLQFKTLEAGVAIFEGWAAEDDLVAVDQ